jgi:hypothetical protein
LKRDALIRELRFHARKSGLPFEVVADRGKGGHCRVHLGQRFTIVKSGELTPTYVKLIKKQLGVEED